MKTKVTKVFVAIAMAGMLVIPTTGLHAQYDSIPNKATGGGEKMLLAGEITTEWQSARINSVTNGSFTSPVQRFNSFGIQNPSYPFDAAPLGIMLMPLVKVNDKLFFDCQVGWDVTGGVSLNEAIAYYRVAPTCYAFAGFVPIRTGLYEGIMDDFTNRFCSAPIGMGIAAAPQCAVGIQGGIQAGYSKLNYQLYVANGPQLDTTGGPTGTIVYNPWANNLSKAVGGSIGFLPFSNSCLEIGLSGQYDPNIVNQNDPYIVGPIKTTSMVAYLNYFHVFNPIMVRVQAQYENTVIQDFNQYTKAGDTASTTLTTFDNRTSGWYAGLTLRASGSHKVFLSNLELGGRIGELTVPQNNPWGSGNISQTTICLTYWLTWKTPINISYDIYTPASIPQSSGPNLNLPTLSSLSVRGMWFF
jgi:hypothetical protein